ncbi:MAG: FG-GAP repeat protein, partial [Xanthomonadales bacterium]|nr:FG-GAP repeat protein [Xanthomonadales bacterium]
FNGDGVDELLIGARTAVRDGQTVTGASYLISGRYQLYRDGFE